MIRAAAEVFLTATLASSIHAQSPARPLPSTFEVASIKANQVGGESSRATTLPGGVFTATNVTLKLLISRAYGVAQAQIQGGPGWIDSETYDISAKADTPVEMSREQARPCLQTLLAERFRLAIHRETRQGNVFSLAIAKNGPKFKEHSGSGRPGIGASTDAGKAEITGTNIGMRMLAEYLSQQAGRPVIDNTGLQGQYDFRVEWATDQARDSSGPSVFAALQEQLGLRLEATLGPIETIVVDRAEKPTEN
jgi:uncharacterized protein (TIGR03435 family)